MSTWFDPIIWKQQIEDPNDPLCVLNDLKLWRGAFPMPNLDGNKYSRGHALICGGEVMTGATRMAARAAQRIGAGLVTLVAPSKAAALYAETLESVIVRSVDDVGGWAALVNQPKIDVILIGPGLGIGELQRSFIIEALKVRKPTVLDADVFTNFSKDPGTILSQLNDQCVLTPHEGEFQRFFGVSIEGNNTDRLGRARAAARQAGCTVVLKGHRTIMAYPEGAAIVNNNAPPWLATAGSGDVLAGMILGLLSQKMPVFPACAAAVWLHGHIAQQFGLGLIAEDLIDGIPKALQNL